MIFEDRLDAGRRLADRLNHLRGADLIILGLPRGGVPVAAEIAAALDAPLDVSVVRKLGVPFQPELGMGAIGEDGVRIINEEVMHVAGVSDEDLAAVEERERAELDRRARRYRGGQQRAELTGRTVIVVDDGIATGATARAACRIARGRGAARVVLAVPVAPPGWTSRMGRVADELICVAAPEDFFAIGQFYRNFGQTTDEEVMACLDRAAARRPVQPEHPVESEAGPAASPAATTTGAASAVEREVEVSAGAVRLAGDLAVPDGAIGVVVFAHGSGSSRRSPRNRLVAARLGQAGLGTLLFDLLTEEEAFDRANVFDTELLSTRLSEATGWLSDQAVTKGLPVGYFGASTGAAAALRAAAEPGAAVGAVVSRGGRPDLAGPAKLAAVVAPTLLIVGSHDRMVLDLNRQAQARLRCENRLAVVPGATHLFEEPGALEQVADLARDWFTSQLSRVPQHAGGPGP